MFKKLRDALAVRCKDMGLTPKTLEDLARMGSESLEEGASEADINAKADLLVPFAKAIQEEVTRQTMRMADADTQREAEKMREQSERQDTARREKTNAEIGAETRARIVRTERYAEAIRLMFAKTVDDIMKLNASMPRLEEGQMFSFASQGERVQKRTEALLRRLGALASAAIRQGVALEWGRANEECDKLVKSVVGKAILNDATRYKAYTKRNLDAMRVFQNRSEGGLNLSERVWRSVEQLREEMEVAITVSMGEGKSAAGMAREVRQCLDDPDLMFRRFRYKIAEKEVRDAEGNVIGKEYVWGRKWKKRVRDEKTGRYRFIDYDKDNYKVGRGVYKSAVRNAMRVARTETNMAYRMADGERWRQMDFVLGKRIHLSGKHPKKDICDRLAGDYPKDFMFTGWHPQCFCYVPPILASEEEMARENEAWARGEEYKARGEAIKDVPDAFKAWVRENEDRIRGTKVGSLPYFIRNNMGVVEGILRGEDGAMKQGGKLQRGGEKIEFPNGYKSVVNLGEEQKNNASEVEKIIGVRRGEPMSFDEADNGRSNIEKGRENCVECVFVHELCTRGFDVTALHEADMDTAIWKLLGKNANKCWTDKNGVVVSPETIDGDAKRIKAGLRKLTSKVGARFQIGWDISKNSGHIVFAEMTKSGLVIYDPQIDDYISVNYILEDMYKDSKLEVLRIDNKLVNCEFVKQIIKSNS